MKLPAHLQPFAAAFITASARHGIPEGVLAAVCDRESRGGEYLRPRGPSGTGDFWARSGHWLGSRGTKTVTELPHGWSAAPGKGPWAVPTDELGWGRGLMQLDVGSHLDWLTQHDWRDPMVNVDKGAEILAEALKVFPGNLAAGIAAYNCGPAAVRRALDDGHDVDRYTTGHDYSADVMRRRAQWLGPGPSGQGSLDDSRVDRPRYDDHGDEITENLNPHSQHAYDRRGPA